VKPRKAPLALLRIGQYDDQERSPITEHLTNSLHQSSNDLGRTLTVYDIPTIDPDKDIRDVIGDAEGILVRTSSFRDFTPEKIRWLKELPAVQILGEQGPGSLFLDHVAPDNQQAGAIAAEYLAEKGSEHLLFASPWRGSRVGDVRCLSFVRTARNLGRQASVVVAAQSGEFRSDLYRILEALGVPCTVTETPKEFIDYIQQGLPEPFGLFVPTDLELALALTQLMMSGFEFGTKNHAIGCDREFRCMSHIQPSPASMDIHIRQIASLAIERLEFRISRPDAPLTRISLSPTLVT
jgi:DNA-binding LacI/PurR family transcriptional regulator